MSSSSISELSSSDLGTGERIPVPGFNKVNRHPQPSSSMSVELIINQGSNAGTVAPIHEGYYLVGRHKECQIRPKSGSVSRRHCLLLHNEDGFGALDLKSTRGTFVNGERIEPHQWCVLSEGDLLRFGKVEFKVSLGGDLPQSVNANESKLETQSTTSQTPESWQNADVADFLDEEDEAEAGNGSDIFVEALTQESPSSAGAVEPSEKSVEVDPQPKKRPPRKKIDHNEYKRKPKRELKLPSLSFGSGEGTDWRLIGVIALVTLAIGAVAYQAYQFQSGPDIQVREDLD